MVLSLGSIGVGNEGEAVAAAAVAGTDVGGVKCCFGCALEGIPAIVTPSPGAEAEATDGGCAGMKVGAATLSTEGEVCVLPEAPCRGTTHELSVHSTGRLRIKGNARHTRLLC